MVKVSVNVAGEGGCVSDSTLTQFVSSVAQCESVPPVSVDVSVHDVGVWAGSKDADGVSVYPLAGEPRTWLAAVGRARAVSRCPLQSLALACEWAGAFG